MQNLACLSGKFGLFSIASLQKPIFHDMYYHSYLPLQGSGLQHRLRKDDTPVGHILLNTMNLT